MKKVNGVNASWKQIDDSLHELKGALTMMRAGEEQSKKARVKIGKCINIIYEEIDELKNGE